MSLTDFLWIVGAFVLALGVLIVVHEFGHYWAARRCNVKILRFSVGFGKALWLRRFGPDGTEWSLAAFPLGGYVKMLDEREGEVAEHERHRAFNRMSIGRRSFIVAAGPVANLLLAVLLYWLLFMQGVEEPRPVLAPPIAGSPAASAKVDAGGTVLKVSGVTVTSWTDVRWQVLLRALDRAPVELETARPDGTQEVWQIPTDGLEAAALEGDVLQALGLRLQMPDLPAVIGEVKADSPAALAGIQAGDRVVTLDGASVAGWNEVARGIRAAGTRTLALEVERSGAVLAITVTPQRVDDGRGKQVARIGIGVRDDPELRRQAMVIVRYGPFDAMRHALAQTWDTAALSLRMMGRMVVGEVSVKNISGPVTIADYAGQSARMGLEHYLRFLALISISLGVLNLLPVPVLDGGHLMYYLAELIKGGSLSERSMEIGQRIGLTLLALLMVVAFYNDINRLVSG